MLRAFVSTNGAPPPARCAIYSAGSTKRREARKNFRLLGLQRQKKQVEEGTSNECECTQSESRYLLCSVISLRESKARKGKDLLQGREREQRQRQTKSKGTDSLHPTLRTSRDGAKHDVAHRKANQPDRERKARSTSTNEAKHDVVEAKHDVVEAKHGVIKAKHGVRSISLKHKSCAYCNLRKAFFASPQEEP